MSDDVSEEAVARCQSESAEDATADGTAVGLDDARATLAEIWRCSDDDAHRRRALRALRAVIAAESTMKAADAFLIARNRAEMRAAFEKLRVVCCLRVGHDVRKKL